MRALHPSASQAGYAHPDSSPVEAPEISHLGQALRTASMASMRLQRPGAAMRGGEEPSPVPDTTGSAEGLRAVSAAVISSRRWALFQRGGPDLDFASSAVAAGTASTSASPVENGRGSILSLGDRSSGININLTPSEHVDVVGSNLLLRLGDKHAAKVVRKTMVPASGRSITSVGTRSRKVKPGSKPPLPQVEALATKNKVVPWSGFAGESSTVASFPPQTPVESNVEAPAPQADIIPSSFEASLASVALRNRLQDLLNSRQGVEIPSLQAQTLARVQSTSLQVGSLPEVSSMRRLRGKATAATAGPAVQPNALQFDAKARAMMLAAGPSIGGRSVPPQVLPLPMSSVAQSIRKSLDQRAETERRRQIQESQDKLSEALAVLSDHFAARPGSPAGEKEAARAMDSPRTRAQFHRATDDSIPDSPQLDLIQMASRATGRSAALREIVSAPFLFTSSFVLKDIIVFFFSSSLFALFSPFLGGWKQSR